MARQTAFERYVLPESNVLFRVARSLTRNTADAEDLMQDTLIRACGAIDRFVGRYPRAWLLTILPSSSEDNPDHHTRQSGSLHRPTAHQARTRADVRWRAAADSQAVGLGWFG